MPSAFDSFQWEYYPPYIDDEDQCHHPMWVLYNPGGYAVGGVYGTGTNPPLYYTDFGAKDTPAAPTLIMAMKYVQGQVNRAISTQNETPKPTEETE